MSSISDLHDEEERLLLELHKVRLQISQEAAPGLGELPNTRAGFYHNHSAIYECGIAYRPDDDYGDRSDLVYLPCKRLVNHSGRCGYEDNTAF